MSTLANLTLWGISRPVFRLIKPKNSRIRNLPATRLEGYFTFTNGSAVVSTTASMVNILEAGDMISSGPSASHYTILTVDSATQLTLSANYTEGTSTCAAYSWRSIIWMPLTKTTRIWFSKYADYGGPEHLVLDDGEIYSRGVKFRPHVEFSWQNLSPENAEKIVDLYNVRNKFVIEVSPHEDVRMRWRMVIDDDFMPANTADKLIGTDVVMPMQGRGLIERIPGYLRSSTSGQFRRVVR